MSKNFDDLFSSWLEDGPTRASERVVEALRADIARTPQRKPSIFRPRGDSAMTTFFKLGALATAGVALLLVALSFRPANQPNVGGSTPSASPSPSTGNVYQSDKLVVPFELTLPAGWSVEYDEQEMVSAVGPGSRAPITIDGEPCRPGACGGMPVVLVGTFQGIDDSDGAFCAENPPAGPTGDTARDVADWMTTVELLGASDPVESEIAGLPAWRVDEDFQATPECGMLHLFNNSALGDVYPDEVKQFYLFQVGDLVMAAVTVTADDATEAETADAEAVLQSLTILEP